MSTTLQAKHRGSPVASRITASRTVPVVIGIARDGHGQPDGLYARTGSPGDPTIWWPHDGEHVEAGHTDSVVWVSVDLQEHEEIRIEPKHRDGAHRFFTREEFTLDEHHRAVSSGPVTMPRMDKHNGRNPKAAGHEHSKPKVEMHEHEYRWPYSVVLTRPGLSRALTLDPVIIIIVER